MVVIVVVVVVSVDGWMDRWGSGGGVQVTGTILYLVN